MSTRFFVAKSTPLAAAVASLLGKIIPAVKVEEAENFTTTIEGSPFPFTGLQTMFEIVRTTAAAPELLGADARDRAHINQWVGLAHDISLGAMDAADAEALLPMSARFVAGTANATVADVLLFVAVGAAAQNNAKSYPKLAKWATAVSSDALVSPFVAATTAAGSPTAGAEGGDSTKAAPKFVKPNEAEIAARRLAKEKEKAEKEKAKAAAAPAAAEGATAAAPANALSSLDLDIRVGLITAIEKHPKADRLYVEKIDLGEASGPRQIVSGLVQYYAAEDLAGRYVLVVANMKAKPLVGVESHGMVLCASVEVPPAKEGDVPTTKLELVEVPAGTAPGERVAIGGKLAPEAPGVSKKIMDLLAQLRTDESGAVKWGDEALTVTKGAITSKIPCALVK